jgi:hypothetical protein
MISSVSPTAKRFLVSTSAQPSHALHLADELAALPRSAGFVVLVVVGRAALQQAAV